MAEFVYREGNSSSPPSLQNKGFPWEPWQGGQAHSIFVCLLMEAGSGDSEEELIVCALSEVAPTGRPWLWELSRSGGH